MACAVFAIPYFFKSFRQNETNYASIYFWLSTTMCLPTCFGLILVQGALNQPIGDQTSIVLVASYLTALFIFVQVQNSLLLAATGWLLSIFICLLFSSFSHADSNFGEFERVFLLPLFAYLTAIVVGSLTNRNIAKIESEKLETAKSIGYSIAHEVRTPLTTIKNRAKGLEEYLPALVKAHKVLHRSSAASKFSDEIYEALASGLIDISDDVDNLHAIVDILLAATKTSRIEESVEVMTASSKVVEAIRDYPYANVYEQELVEMKVSSDFTLKGGPIQLRHVLMNLLKNALYYVQNNRGTKIEVTVDGSSNSIVVSDDGPGIPPADLNRVFDPFFTTTDIHNGSGLGLTFCKLALESMGSTIEAQNVPFGGARFVLTFPDFHVKQRTAVDPNSEKYS